MSRSLRVLALAPYPAEAPSTRYRLVQLADGLEEAGVELTLRTFLDADGWRSVRSGGLGAGWTVVRRLAALRRTLRSAASFDAVLVQRGLSVLFDGRLLRMLVASGRPLVYDFDDAVYLPQAGGRGWVERLRRPRAATTAFCRAASAVVAGNEHLADFAREARGGGGGVHVIPSVVDTDRFRPVARRSDEGPPVVGWVGSDSTLGYLEELAPVFRALAERADFSLRVVAGGRTPDLPGVPYAYERWRPEDEARYFQELDVGLYPLDHTPWSRGKCGFKALQYLACEVPCVAAPVGVLRDMVRPGETGLHATAPEEWVDAVERLLSDPEARARMGRAGRSLVVRDYSVGVAVAGLVRTLRRVVEPS